MKSSIKYLFLTIMLLLFTTAAFGYTNEQRSFLQYGLAEGVVVSPLTQEYADSIGLSWAVTSLVDKEPVIIGARKADNKFVVLWFVPNNLVSEEGVRQMNADPNIAFFSFKASEASTACCYITAWNTDVPKENLDAFFGLVRVAINVSKK